MQQSEGWRGESQGEFPDYAAQLAAARASGRARWLGQNGQDDSTAGAEQSLAGLIHDARNMVSAMDLYCDLLEEPGVLSAPFHHYAGELRLVSGAGRRLLEKLAVTQSRMELRDVASTKSHYPLSSRLPRDSHSSHRAEDSSIAVPGDAVNHPPAGLRRDGRRKVFQCSETVANLAEELRANHSLLTALVGHGITVGLSIFGGRRPIAMTGDDLTRVLVNLVRNAADAMPCGGHLQIDLEEGAEYLALSFTDNGPGILEEALEAIFSPGYTTRVPLAAPDPEQDFDSSSHAWPVQHRGLGLSIVRSLVAAAGGSAWAANRKAIPSSTAAERRGTTSQAAGDISSQDRSALQGAVVMIEFPLLEPPAVT